MFAGQQCKRGPWVEEKTLGSGGFGTVVLWKNEDTGDQIALKRCRVQNEMTPKNRHRWQMEVDIMKRLHHDNVVVALEVPPELNVSKDELPLLAMEYCSRGDLRKALNLEENCCGMQEYEIRCLTAGVASALEYLHNKRIIHRDLKPENIVLQQVDDVIVYKLIDLGYAKELDQGSICTSFVGTLQYLAPELFASKQYSQTVDYWSFGTVVFECITGIRPFLPNVPPVQWHQKVCGKSPDDICAFIDGNNDVQFSKHIQWPNHLCRTMKTYMEQWLRLMLRWDPRARGGGLVPDNTGRPRCFVMLEHILALKIVHVLNVESNQLLAYPLKEENTLAYLQQLLELETKIPIAEQDILLASGISPEPHQSSMQCWSEPSSEEWVVFLFRKAGSAGTPRRPKQLPHMLQCIVKEPKTLLPFNDQRTAWAQAVFFCQEQNKDLKRLILSQRAAMLNLLRINSNFAKLKARMMNEMEKLMARKDHFKESLEFDIQQYNDQANGGVTSERMFSKWTKMGEDIEKYLQLKERISQVDQKSGALMTKIVELQKSPFGKSRQNETLAEVEARAKGLYQELRQTPKEHRASNMMEHTNMVQLVVRCVLDQEKAMTDLYLKQAKPRMSRSNSSNSPLNSSGLSTGPVSLSSVASDLGSGSHVSLRLMEESRLINKGVKDVMSGLLKEQEDLCSLMTEMDELNLDILMTGPATTSTITTTASMPSQSKSALAISNTATHTTNVHMSPHNIWNARISTAGGNG
ncbi:hypothetical protein C0Q70_01782 [Pomacea canaliculata]|uniref:IkappaB kinase n=1 Tax=Pomacea canaliculata TaxID=400727 RepID=A0A2T7Q0F5_POMCA|nr:hypothetical protein C0Q70_01782 [Pomacea canaliculata]